MEKYYSSTINETVLNGRGGDLEGYLGIEERILSTTCFDLFFEITKTYLNIEFACSIGWFSYKL